MGGRTEPFPWNLGSWYVVDFHCEQADISRQPIYYTTTTTMPPSNQGANRFRLNEYLDVEVQVWVAGRYNNYVQAPFTNFQIVITIIAAKAQRLRAGYQHRKWFKRESDVYCHKTHY